MPTAVFSLVAGSDADVRVSSLLEREAATGERFSVVVKSGERMSGTIVSATRRLGRKHGTMARYWVKLADSAATPEFYNYGDQSRLGQSQN